MSRIFPLSALLLMLSGCAAFELSMLAIGALSTYAVPSSPVVLCKTEESIGVTYITRDPNHQHAEAKQVISAHCVDGYIETRREDYPGSRRVFATCLLSDGSPATPAPCDYDVEDDVGFGQTDVSIPDG